MKDNETGGVWAMVLAALTILSNWPMLQKAGEKLLTRWVDGLPFRRLGRRLNDEEQQALLSHEREELDTLTIMLQLEWAADRVTLVEYECPEEGPTLATCDYEQRGPKMASMKQQLRRTPLAPEVWAEVLRVHSSESQSWFVPDVRAVEVPALRRSLLQSGACSVYFQSMPHAKGHCGAMLTISWGEPRALDGDDLRGLHWSGRTLAAVLRAVWHHQRAAA